MRGCSASELHRSCLRVDLFFILSMVGGYFFLTRWKVLLLATGNQKKKVRVFCSLVHPVRSRAKQKKKTTKTENCRRTGPRPRPTPLHVQLNQRPITKPVQIHSRYAAERFRHQADSEARWPRHGSAGEGLAGHRTLAHVRVPQGSGERRRGARSLDQPVR